MPSGVVFGYVATVVCVAYVHKDHHMLYEVILTQREVVHVLFLWNMHIGQEFSAHLADVGCTNK